MAVKHALPNVLNRIFQKSFRNFGSRTALVFGSKRYTYAQLEQQVGRCAAGLKELGAAPEKGVALVLKNSPEFILTYLAASWLGAPAFLVDPGSKSGELHRVFTEGRVAVTVCDAERTSALEEVREQTKQHFSIYSRGGNFEGLMSRRTELSPPGSYDAETAIVQFSSGTTGVQKCIARSHRNLHCEAQNFNETIGVSADDRILCTIPLFHAHGFGNAFLAAFYAGATLVLVDGFNRAAVVELLAAERITIFPAVPLMIELLGQRASGQPLPAGSLHLVFTAGAPLPSAVAKSFRASFGINACQLYGTTEIGSGAINLEPDLHSTLDSVGFPMKNVRIEILREDGSPVQPGEVGEVAIQSPAAASEYLRQPELTLQKFRNGYFWPGDYGRKDANGYLYLEGRADWLVLSSGRKVDPHEVEAAIATFPKVREVVVVGVPGHAGEQVVKAVVVAREVCQAHEIVDFCRTMLADFKVPRLVQFVPEMPRSATGKLLRKDLMS